MARAKSSILAVKKQRLGLPVSKKPVYESLGDGVCVGYRRNQSAGSWIARQADGKGGSWQKVIGLADDFEEADGSRVLSWAQAQSKAFAVAHEGKTPAPSPSALTVKDAMGLYEADLKTRGGDAGNAARLRLHVSAELGQKPIKILTMADLRKWRDDLAEKLSPATVNRTGNAFKAALNLAADRDEGILTRNPWEKGLASLRDAEEARNVIVSDDDIKRIVTAAYGESHEFGLLVEVAAVTGARYSQIAGLTVGDLQDDRENPRLVMPSAKKGKGIKKVLRRPVPIPAALAAKLREASGSRSLDTSLLLKPQRPQTKEERDADIPASPPGPWCKSDHYRPFKRAVTAAFKNEAPTSADDDGDMITIYALRHSSIVRQILAGVPIRVIAVLHDTSVTMIEKNYSAMLSDHSDAVARTAIVDFQIAGA